MKCLEKREQHWMENRWDQFIQHIFIQEAWSRNYSLFCQKILPETGCLVLFAVRVSVVMEVSLLPAVLCRATEVKVSSLFLTVEVYWPSLGDVRSCRIFSWSLERAEAAALDISCVILYLWFIRCSVTFLLVIIRSRWRFFDNLRQLIRKKFGVSTICQASKVNGLCASAN